MSRFSVFDYKTFRDKHFDSIVDARRCAIKSLENISNVSDRYGNEIKIRIMSGKQEVGYVWAYGSINNRTYWYKPTKTAMLRPSIALYKNGKLVEKKRR